MFQLRNPFSEYYLSWPFLQMHDLAQLPLMNRDVLWFSARVKLSHILDGSTKPLCQDNHRHCGFAESLFYHCHHCYCHTKGFVVAVIAICVSSAWSKGLFGNFVNTYELCLLSRTKMFRGSCRFFRREGRNVLMPCCYAWCNWWSPIFI